MHDILPRNILQLIEKRLKNFPAVALLGPRQVGKSTLAGILCKQNENGLYLDLERDSDLNKLNNAESFFDQFSSSFICMDEIQRVPEIFPLLRSEIDRKKRNSQFLILGSASRDLIKQSSESLAGRLAYIEITPFLRNEVGNFDQNQHWLRGGYPLSFLAADSESSIVWREEYIKSFLERDIPNLGFNIPANILKRFWKMLAHCHSQTLNSSKLADSMGVSSHTIKRYIDLLEQTYVIRSLPPFEGNLKKRLVKSPKIYIRDSGLFHALINIENFEDLYSSPYYGASFEGYIVENIISNLPRWNASFYRTSHGAEIDLILEKGNKKIAIEIKSSSAPKVNSSFYQTIDELKIDKAIVVANVKSDYPLKNDIMVMSLLSCINALKPD